MTAATANKNSTTATPATDHVAAATDACCRTAGDAMKAMKSGLDAWTDASRSMFDAAAAAYSKGVAAIPGVAMPSGEQVANPFAAFTAFPAAFEQMTKAMNGLVDANARFATECTALAVDAVRTNARIVERTGEMVLTQVAAAGKQVNTKSATVANPQASIDTARAIFDESSTFARSAADRLLAIQGEHAKNIAVVTDRLTSGISAQVASQFNSVAKSCCMSNGTARNA